MYEVWARDYRGQDAFITDSHSYNVAQAIADNITGLSPEVRSWIEEV
ncbi:hypothetical protein KIV66_gp83 [Mycobacterium phage MyraDee]|uniref:Uncharacterized protein n=1 Tax=Mycobacterium phage MyraDee TaxID=2024303 RepID=A0A222YZG5_9CAUD|nr:hypothetical protein KIV66_gp83 [Mycobacterium phage MyraDee]ASR77190.1 hypothetical protein SEA_MYRADEE_83 [Mycobacterium phage MyraDee]